MLGRRKEGPAHVKSVLLCAITLHWKSFISIAYINNSMAEGPAAMPSGDVLR